MSTLLNENIQNIYGLSPMQKNMLINYVIEPSSTAYVEQFDFRIRGDLNPQRMKGALEQLSQRYDILRTVFSYKKTQEPRQVVLKSRPPQFHVQDLRDAEEPEKIVESFKERDREQGFDLSRDVLLRCHLLRLGERYWSFVFTFHHIIMDGWSIAPLFKELFQLYESHPHVDASVGEPRQYSEYIRWLEKQREEEARSYWMDYLEGYEKPVPLPSKGTGRMYSHKVHSFHLPPALTQGLYELARQRKWTVNSIFQTAWGIVLQKYHYSQDAVFGTVVSGRPPELEDVESIIGLFINTVPLRVRSEVGDSFASLCSRVQAGVFSAVPYQYYPLYEIQSNSPLNNKLLDHVIVFENYPLAEQLRKLGEDDSYSLYVEDVKVFERTNYDFNIIVNPGDHFVINFVYNEQRYEVPIILGLERSLLTVLQSVQQDPDQAVTKINICSPADRSIVLEQFNKKPLPYPAQATIDGLFKETVARYPNDIALLWRDQKLTYAQLDEWSDRLAYLMKEMGLGPGSKAGLFLPRCSELLAGMLAILKVGAAYVPFDLSNTKERLAFMIEDSGVELICTRSDLTAEWPTGLPMLYLNEDTGQAPAGSLPIGHDAQSPAYMMYTSGSTGKPKGCIITHQNILRLVYDKSILDYGPEQVISFTSSPSFDTSTFEIWGALLHGGALAVMDDQDILDARRLKERIHTLNLRSMWLTSALFNRLSDQNPEIFNALESLVVGGDVLSVPHVRKVMRTNPHIKFVNGYGPTENTSFSTAYTIQEEDLTGERIPIGHPLDNSTAYIVDAGLNLLPVGAVGELCVGGDGVSLGYHKRQELTNERFTADPFKAGGRMYRTGDMARWLPDGRIDFLGRFDSQVKIRGYRVELGEIERVMAELPEINEVIVRVKEFGQDKHLCAYYTSAQEPDLKAWRKILSAKLPGYMVPDFYMKMDLMPLTVNGKVDHRALPEPVLQIAADSSPSSRMLTQTEKVIVEVCARVLGVEPQRIGVNENFFEFGINSLKMITINNLLREKLNRDIPVAAMFEHPSIFRLAEYIQQSGTEEVRAEENAEQQAASARDLLLKTKAVLQRLEDSQ